MKFLIGLLMAIPFLVGNYNPAYAQNDSSSKQAIQMLTEFYSAYSSIKFIFKNDKKLDSLMTKYCTPRFRKESIESRDDYGQDIMTNDYGINLTSLKTLKIVKAHSKKNTYIISYMGVQYPESPKMPVIKQVTFPVTVIKEGARFKIADVANNL